MAKCKLPDSDAVRIDVMTFYQPNGWFKEEDGTEDTPDEFEEECRVVIVSDGFGYVSCPDCIADERLSDVDLIAMEHSGDELSCNLCKDTGKLWVSL